MPLPMLGIGFSHSSKTVLLRYQMYTKDTERGGGGESSTGIVFLQFAEGALLDMMPILWSFFTVCTLAYYCTTYIVYYVCMNISRSYHGWVELMISVLSSSMSLLFIFEFIFI